MTENIVALVALIDRLKAQHRAGVTPAYGEQDQLFELAAAVKGDIAAHQAGMPVRMERDIERVVSTAMAGMSRQIARALVTS